MHLGHRWHLFISRCFSLLSCRFYPRINFDNSGSSNGQGDSSYSTARMCVCVCLYSVFIGRSCYTSGQPVTRYTILATDTRIGCLLRPRHLHCYFEQMLFARTPNGHRSRSWVREPNRHQRRGNGCQSCRCYLSCYRFTNNFFPLSTLCSF